MQEVQPKPAKKRLTIIEAVEESNYSVEELFQKAATGNLTINFKTPINWKVEGLCSIKSGFLQYLCGGNLDEITKREIDTFGPKYNEDDKILVSLLDRISDIVESYLVEVQYIRTNEAHPPADIAYLAPITIYRRTKVHNRIFNLPINNPCRIAPLSFVYFLNGLDTLILPKVSDCIKIPAEQNEQFFIVPETNITIQEALKDDRIFVWKKDIQRLSGESLNPDDLKPKGGVFRKSLLTIIYGMATGSYRNKRNKIFSLKEIKQDIESVGLALSDDTINKILKEAAELTTKLDKY